MKKHLHDLLYFKINNAKRYTLYCCLFLVFCFGMLLCFGLKDRLNIHLQHKKLNLLYCVRGLSGPKAYI